MARAGGTRGCAVVPAGVWTQGSEHGDSEAATGLHDGGFPAREKH